MSQFVTIIGGGIYGTTLAWHLARRRIPCQLYEADTIAAGASGGPGLRGIRSNGRASFYLPLMRRALERWPRLAEELDHDTGFRVIGSLRLYEENYTGLSGGFVTAPVRAELHRRHGLKARVIDAAETHALAPGLTDRLIGALHCPGDGVADHTQTTIAFATAAQRHGALVHTGTPILEIRHRHGRAAELVTAAGDAYPVAGTLAILANAGTAELLAGSFGLRAPVWNAHITALFATPPAGSPLSALVGHDSRRVALKRVPDGSIMISGGWTLAPDERPASAELTAATRANLEQATQILPALAAATALRPAPPQPESVSLDARPIITAVSGVSNAVVGFGWSGEGLAVAPAVAELLADWLASGSVPPALRPFDVDRFPPAETPARVTA